MDLSRCGRFVEERNMSRVPGTEPERSSQQHAPSVSQSRYNQSLPQLFCRKTWRFLLQPDATLLMRVQS